MTALLHHPTRQPTSSTTEVEHGALVRIDLDAVAANVARLAAATTGEVMAVVKADGFGLGAVEIARTALANGATQLGVTGMAEAAALRRARITAPILSWLHPVDTDFSPALIEDIDIAVPSLAHLARVARTAPNARIHLQIDTGLARDGAAPAECCPLLATAARLERDGMVRVVGLMGHLPRAGDPADASNRIGRERFLAALALARRLGLQPRHRHLAATEATLLDPLSHFTVSRCGAGVVGVAGGLRGVATLTAPIVEVRRVAAGTPVGYDHTWVAPRETVLGLLPIGYADGLPRIAGRSAEVLIGRRRRPVVGRISMDTAVVDLGTRLARPGERVTVFGPGDHGEPTVGEWAAWAQTLPHEILTGLGARVRRSYGARR